MPEWMMILLKINLSLAVIWLFYKVFLRGLTFYGWNRVYLLAYSGACLIIPFININPWLSASGMPGGNLVDAFPTVNHLVTPLNSGYRVDNPGIGYTYWFALVLLAGSLVMGIRLSLMYLSLLRISSRARLLVKEPVSIYETPERIIPFSFGNKIFIHDSSIPENDLETIIRHEFIHVKQKHSIDILFSEIICVLAWYNPFAWLIRHAIRQNLEFLADQQVLNHGTDRKTYQWLLLKVTGHAPLSIANQFNLSSLKNRLIMMNKNQSARTQLLKFLLMLPILVILLMAFRNAGESIIPGILNQGSKITAYTVADTLPPPTPPQAPVPGTSQTPPAAVVATPKPGSRPTPLPRGNAKGINVNKSNKATVELKNGKKEYYDLNNPVEKKNFEKKYGFPPPPPPIPAVLATTDIVASVDEEAEPVAEVGEVAVKAEVASPVIAAVPVTRVHASSSPVKSVAPVAAVDDEIDLEGEVLLNLTAQSTQADIDRQVAGIKAKGYSIEITSVVFNQGRLTSFEGYLGNKNKKNHFKAADFKELFFTESEDKDDDSGFRFYIVKGRLSVN